MKPKSIILKSKLILCTLIFATLITSACREQNLLAYGKRASCVGVHHQYTANRFASWGRDNIAPSLVLQNRQQSSFPALQPLQVQVLDPNTGEIEHNFQFELNSDIRELTMSENENIIAINKGFDVSSQIFLYTFNSEQQPAFDAVIERAARPVWHPSELLLAAIYYPEDGELASNKIA
jgi:hypothetical protein